MPLVKRSAKRFKKLVFTISRDETLKKKLKFLTGADKIAAASLTKVMEHFVAVRLLHLGMNIVTRVAQFCDFLG